MASHVRGESSGTLGTTLENKITYAAYGGLWKAMHKYVPFSKRANQTALVHRIEKLLENPLNIKNSKDLIKSFPDEAKEEVTSIVKDIQKEFAKLGPIKTTKVGLNKNLRKSDGAIGKGLYTKKETLTNASRTVEPTNLATVETISDMLGREVKEAELRNIPNLNQKLIKRGYVGIETPKGVMLFPETTVGVKKKAQRKNTTAKL